MSTEMTKQTEATLTHHLQAFAEGDLNAILSDYVEASVRRNFQANRRALTSAKIELSERNDSLILSLQTESLHSSL